MNQFTDNQEINSILNFLSGDSQDDPRFTIKVGDIVTIVRGAGGSPVEGTIARVTGRRNGYPEPFFKGFWFPLLYLKHLDGHEGGGEIHMDCVRLATEEERKSVGVQG